MYYACAQSIRRARLVAMRKPVKRTVKPDSKPVSGLYRVEFIRQNGRNRFLEAAQEATVKKALAEMRPKTEYITCNVYQYGVPVQIFPRLVNGDWYAAVGKGPLAHLAHLKGGS